MGTQKRTQGNSRHWRQSLPQLKQLQHCLETGRTRREGGNRLSFEPKARAKLPMPWFPASRTARESIPIGLSLPGDGAVLQ